MYTAAPLPSKFNNTSSNQLIPYNGDSYIASYSPPQPTPGVTPSNLQTLRKFSNIESLQNLNVSNDSPRASYSSSSSSTGSTSSNLIIPEIFKQDCQPNYPTHAPHLPPKSRDLNQHSPQQTNFIPTTSSYHHSPQVPYSPSSFYNANLHQPNNNSVSPNKSSGSAVHNNFNGISPHSGSLTPNTTCISSINTGSSKPAFDSYSSNNQRHPCDTSKSHVKPPLSPTGPRNHGYPPSSYPYSQVKSTQPFPSTRFTSYPETSSFTCYSSSSSSHCTVSPATKSYSSSNQQQHPQGPPPPNMHPDFRRLSDSNSRKLIADLSPVPRTVPNEYPQQIFHSKYVPERPGEHRTDLNNTNSPSQINNKLDQLNTGKDDSSSPHVTELLPTTADNTAACLTGTPSQSTPATSAAGAKTTTPSTNSAIPSSKTAGSNCQQSTTTTNSNSGSKNSISPASKNNSVGTNREISQQKEQQKSPAVKSAVTEHNNIVNKASNPSGKTQQRDSSQARSQQNREGRPMNRAGGGSHGYARPHYYSQNTQEYLNKSQEYLGKVQDYNDSQDYPNKKPDYPVKPHDYQSKSQEFLNKYSSEYSPPPKSQEYHGKLPDYPIKPQPYKLQSGFSRVQNTSSTPGSAQIRERLTSPQRSVGSPPVKLQEMSRVQSPPMKISDTRHEIAKMDKVNSPINCGKSEGGVSHAPLSPGHNTNTSGHFLQQYPERDNSKSQAPVWEAGYLLEKYSGGPYSPLPPVHPAARSEKAIDDPEQLNDGDGRASNPSTAGHKYQAEKEDQSEVTSSTTHGGLDHNKVSKVAAKLVPVRVVPDQLEIYNQQGSTQHAHIPQGLNHSLTTDTTTDCGSLSKSSSDGDRNIMNRKRPPTKLKSKRRNILSFPHHLSVDELRLIQRREESYSIGAGSSSDDNRSSGHASMSDGHTSSSPPLDTLPRHHDHHAVRSSALKSVPEDERLSAGVTAGGGARAVGAVRRGPAPQKAGRYRMGGSNPLLPKDELSHTLENATGLEEIKLAIEQLTMQSQVSRTSYSTSTYSSMSGSESEPVRRLVRHSSLETINTNVTAADEFVWVDSHDRLVELQQLPWSNHDVLRVIQNGRVKEQLDRVSIEAVPRLSYLLQRALVRVAREAQRLTRPLAMCSKQEVSSAFKIVLSPALADSCIKSCLRAAAMYTVSGDNLRQAKAARAGLNLSTGRFMRWMCDVRVGKFIHEYAAVYLTAGLENLLEEMVLQCLPPEKEQMLTATLLEHSIANNADLWGLLQPYAHLNAGRTATGALCLPRWASTGSIEKSSTGSSSDGSSTASASLSTPDGASEAGNQNTSRCSSSMTLTPDEQTRNAKTLEQSLLTTCVGSLAELSDLLTRVASHHQQSGNRCAPSSMSSTSSSSSLGVSSPSVVLSSSTSQQSSGSSNRPLITWGPSALHALFYFMRCSQLEHAEHASRAPIQELVYERPYIVLPPLVEWVRVATAHTEHRHSTVVDKDDVMQAARLLLPGVDCPVRMIGYEELMCPRRQLDEIECAKKFKVDLAFKMLSCGRTDLVPHALQLLPATKVNTVNEYGLTPLMLACIRGDETLVQLLLDANADVDAETPPTGPAYLMANPETQHWTALTYATIHGHYNLAQTLLLRGANVEGGATMAEEKCTETPLQVAVAAGHTELVTLLLSCGGNPYLSTLMKDSLCYSGAAQRGCYAAVAVAAAHGQRNILHRLLAHPTQYTQQSGREVLSLEEILAEGASSQSSSDTEHRGRQSFLSGTAGDGTLNSLATEDHRSTGKSTVTSSGSDVSQNLKLNKQQVKTLQEAMYHSAESGHLDMTLDLRNLGVPWTLHCWMHTLATAHEHRLETIIDQLLQDFLQVWPDDYSAQFVDECLPLLFTIFRFSKNEGTTLLLADIFSSCYGKEPIKEVRDTSETGGAQIDTNFVNNPELSDVQFRVEGKIFYAHKIILVNASQKFKELLSSKFSEGSPHVIYDIRYDIFELVMQSLYLGGCKSLQVDDGDVLELMLAADFFRLESLLRYCESRCSTLVHLHNVVTMYIHAKVYGAQQLVEYCQGFLLQNMVALLTYDDSVRRLIFGKKYQHHDVLNGLLSTLQYRIRERSSPRAGKN